jgi:signal transduction histidine kinase
MFRTLRSRLILNTVLPILVILPVVGLIISSLLHTQLVLANIAGELTRQGVLVADYAAARSDIFNNIESAQDFVARISPNVPAKVMLLDANGRLLVSSDPGDTVLVGTLYSVPDINRLIAANSPAEVTYGEEGIQDIVVPVVTQAHQLIGYIRLANPLADIYEQTSKLRLATWLVVGGGLIAGIILALVLSRQLERPLRHTTEAAYQLAYDQRLDPLKEEGPREVRMLVQAFNAMTERLHTLEDARRRLLANLVHELGTPLGALRSAVVALQNGAVNQPELRDDLLKGMDEELVLLKRLTEELASLHDQELGLLDLHIQPLNTSAWLNSLLAPWSEAAQEKHLTWTTEIPADLPALNGDQDRLAQAVGNLLSNAIRYTPQGGQIAVRAAVVDGRVHIDVEDTGPGIEKAEMEKIFQPFQRGKSAKRFAPGMGLGLSIARDLIQAHDGTLTVASVPGKGSVFTIALPLQIEGELIDSAG